jgi:hypothetical protein
MLAQNMPAESRRRRRRQRQHQRQREQAGIDAGGGSRRQKRA